MPDIVSTSEGKAIDIEGLRLKNEKTVAVGNMRVNARGDELDPITGAVFRTRAERMKDHYKLNTVVPTDEPVHRSARSAAAKAPAVEKPMGKPVAPVQAPQSVAFPSAEPVKSMFDGEPVIEKVVDNSIDPNTWIDTPPPAPEPEPEVTVVSSRPVDGGIEVEYSDGSMEVIPSPKPTKSLKRI